MLERIQFESNCRRRNRPKNHKFVVENLFSSFDHLPNLVNWLHRKIRRHGLNNYLRALSQQHNVHNSSIWKTALFCTNFQLNANRKTFRCVDKNSLICWLCICICFVWRHFHFVFLMRQKLTNFNSKWIAGASGAKWYKLTLYLIYFPFLCSVAPILCHIRTWNGIKFTHSLSPKLSPFVRCFCCSFWLAEVVFLCTLNRNRRSQQVNEIHLLFSRSLEIEKPNETVIFFLHAKNDVDRHREISSFRYSCDNLHLCRLSTFSSLLSSCHSAVTTTTATIQRRNSYVTFVNTIAFRSLRSVHFLWFRRGQSVNALSNFRTKLDFFVSFYSRFCDAFNWIWFVEDGDEYDQTTISIGFECIKRIFILLPMAFAGSLNFYFTFSTFFCVLTLNALRYYWRNEEPKRLFVLLEFGFACGQTRVRHWFAASFIVFFTRKWKPNSEIMFYC